MNQQHDFVDIEILHTAGVASSESCEPTPLAPPFASRTRTPPLPHMPMVRVGSTRWIGRRRTMRAVVSPFSFRSLVWSHTANASTLGGLSPTLLSSLHAQMPTCVVPSRPRPGSELLHTSWKTRFHSYSIQYNLSIAEPAHGG